MKTNFIFGMIMVLVLTACATEPTPTSVAPTEPETTPPTPTTAPHSTATDKPTTAPTLAPTDTPAPAPTTSAANADVLFVKATQSADGTWRFDVTVAHPDTGWEDYADGWDVVLPDASVVKVTPANRFTRLLAHPHETEQPFTRSQSGIRIPDGVTTVTVRAHDLVDGWGGKTVVVDLTQASGDGFEVQK